ncbi:hypothetical protein PFAG_03824 [Plasmodium falciparum Santa Lucia]|uniref:Uncharacterized protein n=1 Tax=Plasmodium falciparum Santa Lucia TaxID=478859 RepID=W7FV48_PLAFA|nr:hypothetical protein PFAG_03824 [Plasmodium falciparum Santa Lucia]
MYWGNIKKKKKKKKKIKLIK